MVDELQVTVCAAVAEAFGGVPLAATVYVAVELQLPGLMVTVYVPAPVTDVLAAVGETIVEPPGPAHE